MSPLVHVPFGDSFYKLGVVIEVFDGDINEH